MKTILKKVSFCLIMLTNLFYSSAQKISWTLKECIDYAITNNLDIQNQQLIVANKKIDYDQSKLNVLPAISANYGYGWNFGGTQSGQEAYEEQNNLTSELGINANIELFKGLNNYHLVKKSLSDLNAASMDLEYQKDLLSLNITSSFLKVLLDKELIKAQQEQIAYTMENQKKIEYQYESGSIPKLPLLENKAQLTKELAKVTEIENNSKYDLLVLTQLLKVDTPDSFDVAIPENPLSKAEVSMLSANDLFNIGSETRPEIAAAKYRVESAQIEHSLLLSRISPDLSIQTSLTNNSIITDKKNNTNNMYIGFLVQVPIFNKMETKNLLKSNSIEVNIKKNEYEIEKLKYWETLQKACTNTNAGYANMKADKATLDAAIEAYNYAKESFESGAISFFDMNELKNKAAIAQSDYYKSMYQFIFSTMILNFYNNKPFDL